MGVVEIWSLALDLAGSDTSLRAALQAGPATGPLSVMPPDPLGVQGARRPVSNGSSGTIMLATPAQNPQYSVKEKELLFNSSLRSLWGIKCG